MSSAKEMALRFFNALHHKNEEQLAGCLQVGGRFEDVLPNGTLVKSAEHLLTLHTHFFTDENTGFRPFDRNRYFPESEGEASQHRPFHLEDIEVAIEFEGGGFYRIAAEVDRQQDFRVKDSMVTRKYMYIGIVIENNGVRHVQNTPFEPSQPFEPH